MEAELDVSLGYGKNQKGDLETTNKRNGHSPKTVKSQYGELQVDIPRDRNGEFEPKLIPKYQRDFSAEGSPCSQVPQAVTPGELFERGDKRGSKKNRKIERQKMIQEMIRQNFTKEDILRLSITEEEYAEAEQMLLTKA